jgi:hypothetical protein
LTIELTPAQELIPIPNLYKRKKCGSSHFELYAIKSPPCVEHVRPGLLPALHLAHILKTLN